MRIQKIIITNEVWFAASNFNVFVLHGSVDHRTEYFSITCPINGKNIFRFLNLLELLNEKQNENPST